MRNNYKNQLNMFKNSFLTLVVISCFLTTSVVFSESPNSNTKPNKDENTSVFHAKEQQGVIGISSVTEKENAKDNFFTVTLPNEINLSNYDILLEYDLYGLEGAIQTTKSINGIIAYGGQSLKINKEWNKVQEYLNPQDIKHGINEIFFTRRANKKYRYEIKNLNIKLIKKRQGTIFLNEDNIKNFNGNVHISGYTSATIDEIKVLGNSVIVKEGRFEQTLKNISKSTKQINITYETIEGLKGEEFFELGHTNDEFDYLFSELTNKNNTNSFQLKETNTAEFHNIKVKFFENETEEILLHLRGLQYKDVVPLNSDIKNVTLGKYNGYRVKTNKQTDSLSLKLHLEYDEAMIPDGYGSKDVRTFAYNRKKREWTVLPIDSIDYENKVIITKYNGDTDYVNGVIKVPEMAETASFTPTTITDMEYANPASGIVSIAPPSASNTGTASTSFPIKLPAGRNGMAPSLGVNYSSEAGNGWMGLGWNLQLPAITLDTRWGVPRFDQINETEIYQLNGETMVMKVGDGEYTNPHRHSTDITRSNNRDFYLRKEGSYQKIVRYGDSPQNFRWIIWDKYGNRSYYGGTSGVVVENSVVRDENNNITHWALMQTVDPFGNYVRYNYSKGTEDVNGVTTQYCYPNWIKYTLKTGATSNYYQVDFTRNNYTINSNESISRPDGILNARTGVLMSTMDLLTEIKITFQNGGSQRIRSYRFDYIESAFKKMQLSKISEYDTADNLFYSNTMEYYDDIENNMLVGDNTVTWNGIDDSVGSPLLDIAPNGTQIPNGSALGTSTTSGYSAGLRFGIGLGKKVKSVNNTIGGSYNYSQSKEKTRISFLDINGDGLPDKVYSPNSGNVRYLPNLGIDSNGQGIFGTPKEVVNGLNKLDNSKSKTNTTGVDANLFGLIGAGKSWSKTRTATDGYFIDINGDGLPDVVSGGVVKFNKTSPWDNINLSNVGFNVDVSNTQNPIVTHGMDDDLIAFLDLETEDELRAEHSQFDHVKVWKAPYTGTVNIGGTAILVDKNDCGYANEPNQFKLTIEVGTEGQTSPTNQISERALQNIDDSQPYNITRSVVKNELYFFRIHNKNYGCGGEVKWNPIITYNNPNNISPTTDENGKNQIVFEAESDYIMNNGSGWSPSTNDTSIDFVNAFNLDIAALNAINFSDDITFVIEKTRYTHETSGDNEGNITAETPYIKSVTYNPISGNLTNLQGPSWGIMRNITDQFANGTGPYSYSFRFYAESDSNVKWDAINWRPAITNQEGTLYYPSVNYHTFDDNVNQSNYQLSEANFPIVNIDNDGDNPLIRVSHNMFQQNYPGIVQSLGNDNYPVEINWVVKEEIDGVTAVLYSRKFYLYRDCVEIGSFDVYACNYHFETPQGTVINMSNPPTSYFQFDISKEKIEEIKSGTSGKVYAAFYIDNHELGESNGANITFSLHPNEVGNYTFSNQTFNRPFIAKNPTFHGWSYRGWGQFLYNGGLKYTYDQEGNITSGPVSFEGAIDMFVFDYDADSVESQMDDTNNDPDNVDINNSTIRYTFYTQDNETKSYKNAAIKSNIDTPIKYGYNDSNQLTASVGRFAEHNIYDLWTDPESLTDGTVFVGLKQRSFSKGKSTSGNVGIGAAGASGTKSEASMKVLNQYVDLNGDRYPDVVTDGKIQFTDMQGGLSNTIRDNNFVSGNRSKDATIGVTIAGVAPNSTASDNVKNTKTNVNSGINTSDGNSYDSRQWIDINGDGLSDRVTIYKTEIRVQLNKGYGFSDEITWGSGYNDLFASTRNNVGLGGGISNASWAAGFGVAQSTANLNAALIDVNNDGLPDLVKLTNSGYKFHHNNGTSFETNADQTFYNGLVDRDTSFTGNIYGTGTYGFFIKLWILTIKFTFTPTIGFNAGVNEKKFTIQDIDGDGFPDVLQEGNDNGDILAKLNRIGKTHKLKSVKTPLGGSWTVDYNREGNTFDLPNNQWVLTSVATHDGFTGDNAFGTDKTLTSFTYENPEYNRREREFIGFGKVRVDIKDPSSQETYRYSLSEYHTDNIYLKGAPKRNSLYDSSDNILNESSTLYNIMNPNTPQTNMSASEGDNYLQIGLSNNLLDESRLFVAPVKTISTKYENGDGLSLEQQFKKYDDSGNLLEYINFGDTYTDASSSDAYRTEMTYYSGIPGVGNSKGFIKNMRVLRHNGNQLLRERNAEYHLGKLKKVSAKLNDTDTNTATLTYDAYGNVIKSTMANGYETMLEYDNTLHTYPINTSNTFGHTSLATYNYLFGTALYTRDTNGEQLRTRIDNRGRLIEVLAPHELGNQNPNRWTLRMQYQGESAILPNYNGTNSVINAVGSFEPSSAAGTLETNAKHHAVTRHNVEDAHGGQLLTVSLVDGFGKAIQLKKTLYANDNGGNPMHWLVSGKERKDAFGRTLEAYLPTADGNYPNDPNSLLPSVFNYNDMESPIPPTIAVYDVQNRATSVTQPGEDQSTTTFDLADGMFVTNTTNELGQTFETYSDVKGRQRKTIQNSELTTQFHYNAIGEKIKVRNHQGYETLYKYDLAGRRLEERHPDRGLTTFKYDITGNLTARSTSNLILGGGQAITYQYNYNRLEGISYPENPENDVQYIYGEPNDTYAIRLNAVGRLYMQKDASGAQGFGYDQLGNINRHLRSVSVAGRHSFWYETLWTYDSHNRVHDITYPDGEVVDYNYNQGGSLNSISRSIPNVPNTMPILSSIKYNDFGERTEIAYGNGTTTSYAYDNLRRLKDLSHQFFGFGITNTYEYDDLNNIITVNTVDPGNSLPSAGQIGGPISHNYTYDNYNRLVNAHGRYTGPNDVTTPLLAQEYNLDMSYDLAHNIISKTQTHVQGAISAFGSPITNPETMQRTNYHLDYGGYASGVNVVQGQGDEYGYVQPHAPREIIETPQNGGIINTDPRYKKKVIEYDANGNQLVIKQEIFEGQQGPAYEGIIEPEIITLRKNLWDEENRLRAVDLNPEDKSAHPISIYTYDASGQRAVRYIPGRLDAKSNANNVSSNTRDEVVLYPNALVTAKALSKPGTAPQSGDLISSYTKHYYIGAQRINSTLGTAKDLGLFPDKADLAFPLIRNLANLSVQESNIGLYATYSQLGQSISLSTPEIEDEVGRYTHDPEKYDAYWYHSDHLGSSSYISNSLRVVSQHMEYLPFGELLVDEHLNSFNTPYKFNAKELDEETGNYYYGARYYDPKTSIWLSVDPLAEKMPEWSSYNYAFSNPVKYTDPTGMAPEVIDPPIKHEVRTAWIYTHNEDGSHTVKSVTTGSTLDITNHDDGSVTKTKFTTTKTNSYTVKNTGQYDENGAAILEESSTVSKTTKRETSNYDNEGYLVGDIKRESNIYNTDYTGKEIPLSKQESIVSAFGSEVRAGERQNPNYTPIQYTYNDAEAFIRDSFIGLASEVNPYAKYGVFAGTAVGVASRTFDNNFMGRSKRIKPLKKIVTYYDKNTGLPVDKN